MAQAALNSRTAAKVAYDVAKGKAASRAAPEDGNVNLRLFEPVVEKAQTLFDEWELAHVNYIGKAQLSGQDMEDALKAGNTIADTHDLWMCEMKDTLVRLKAANAPPPPVVVTDAVKKARFNTAIEACKKDIEERTVLLETTVSSITTKISALQLNKYEENCQSVVGRLETQLRPLIVEIQKTDAAKWEEYEKVKVDFSSGHR